MEDLLLHSDVARFATLSVFPLPMADSRRRVLTSCPIVYTVGMEPLNRLDNVLDRFAVRAHQIRLGPLCDRRRFDAGPGQGFLHILREGRLTVVDGEHGAPRVVSEPSVL